MSGAIVVPLTEMQQLAEQWRATITEMDAMVQHIARDIASIPDNGKGLNEVRSRGRTVGSHHQQLLVQGMAVQKQVVDSVQRFSQADQELAGMVRSMQGNYVLSLIRDVIGSYQISDTLIKQTQTVIADNSDSYLDWGLTITDKIIELAKFKGWVFESGGELASRILTYTDIIKDIGEGLKAGFVDGNVDLALHHFAGAASIAQLAYGTTLLQAGLVVVGVGATTASAIAVAIPAAIQGASWGIGKLQDNLRNTSGLEVYAKTLEPIRQITDLKGVLTEANKTVWLNRQKDWMQGGLQGLTDGIARDWTDFTGNIIPNKAHEMYQDRVEARQKTIDIIANNSYVKEHFSYDQVENLANTYSMVAPIFVSVLPSIGIANQVLGL
jgi:hypothetical protein